MPTHEQMEENREADFVLFGYDPRIYGYPKPRIKESNYGEPIGVVIYDPITKTQRIAFSGEFPESNVAHIKKAARIINIKKDRHRRTI